MSNGLICERVSNIIFAKISPLLGSKSKGLKEIGSELSEKSAKIMRSRLIMNCFVLRIVQISDSDTSRHGILWIRDLVCFPTLHHFTSAGRTRHRKWRLCWLFEGRETSGLPGWPFDDPWPWLVWLLSRQRVLLVWMPFLPLSQLTSDLHLWLFISVSLTLCPATCWRWSNAGSMSGHRLRHWPDIKPALGHSMPSQSATGL